MTKNTDIPHESESGRGNGWNRENALLIEDASPEAVQEILEFSVRDLAQNVLTACQTDIKVPAGSLDPVAMQRFLKSVGISNYREMAPPPIAKPQAA